MFLCALGCALVFLFDLIYTWILRLSAAARSYSSLSSGLPWPQNVQTKQQNGYRPLLSGYWKDNLQSAASVMGLFAAIWDTVLQYKHLRVVIRWSRLGISDM